MTNSPYSKIFLTILILFLTTFLLGQISNDDIYNISVRTTGYRYDPDNQNGTNYITFLLDAAADISGSDRCLVDIDDGSGYSHEVRFDYDTPETRTDTRYYRHLLTKTNTDQTYYLTWYAYQDNCNPRLEYEGSCCGFLCFGKEDVGLYYQCRLAQLNAFRTGPVNGSWYQYWRLVSANVGVRIEHTWRYYMGEGHLRPLTFGTITQGLGRKIHFNKSNGAVSGASTDLGYRNNWRPSHHPAFNNGNDVTYSFTINEFSQVSISTLFTSTDFDSRLHLLHKNGTSWEYIDSNSDYRSFEPRAYMQKILHPGEYYVVVEGDNEEEGTFVLEIKATEGNTNCSDLTFTLNPEDQIWNVNSATVQTDAILEENQWIIFNAEEFVELRNGNTIESGGQLDIYIQPCIEDD